MILAKLQHRIHKALEGAAHDTPDKDVVELAASDEMRQICLKISKPKYWIVPYRGELVRETISAADTSAEGCV